MKDILTGKVLLSALVIASLSLCASLIYILAARPGAPASGQTGLVATDSGLTVIPAPSSTPLPPPPTLTSLPPTATVSPTPAPGEIAIGVYVQISNTGEEGLNIRAEPGLSAQVIFSGFDSEVFLVNDGPVEADGYLWWDLIASYDAARTGWAAANFLTVIESP